MGGTFSGQIQAGRVASDAVPLAQHASRPLAEVIRAINKRSNNVMARVLLLTLGAEQGGGTATEAGSVAVLKHILAEQRLMMPELVIENGSGLSRSARISADSLAALLTLAWRSPYMPEFVSSLAISGMDGTVRRRLSETGVPGRAHLKTGTLKDVRALAGYVISAQGKHYVVVSIINDARAYAAQGFEDALIAWLATR
jgi:D-alanyl-D-alanine carboxypeptidase/D-alanyl-D-alanine-endopeptidase (penicillin-binding protein 4)